MTDLQARPIFQIPTKAGIQRDGTLLDSAFHIAGQWVRFYRGRAKKIGGYRAIVEDLTYQPRGIHVYSKNNTNMIYLFSSADVRLLQVDNNLTGTSSFDTSPVAMTATVTMTIASPCVVTWNTNGLKNGQRVTFTTTGALPTGLTVGTEYYVISVATNTFSLAATLGGSAINTSGAQSGTHTADAGPLQSDANYLWQVTSLFDATGNGGVQLIAHPGSNLNDISASRNNPLYKVTAGNSASKLTLIDDGAGGVLSVSGGVVALQPNLVAYGNDGLLRTCNANNVDSWQITVGGDADEVNVAGTKIVYGLPIRGGGQAPAGLFWALDAVIKMTTNGNSYNYDTISTSSTVLSSQSIVEYDGVFFWAGIDRFYYYSGRVEELPNQMNVNWFFDNLNFDQRQKVWATVIPRWGEIWWYYPHGEDEEECSRYVIYNVREKTWYDGELRRGCGFPAKTLRFPIWCGNDANVSSKYVVFAHELGHNKVEAGSEVALDSYVETSDFGFPTGGTAGEQPNGQDYWTRLIRVEPDVVQTGEMTLDVIGTEFANADEKTTSYSFDPSTTKVDMREQRRMIRLRLGSNVVDGDYELGRILLHTEPGDIRS